MKVLALEPYHGGSHRAFLEGWIHRSRHDWTLFSLPPYKWKWRMRHAAIHFAEQVGTQTDRGRDWEVLFCSDMLNLAEFRGLVPPAVRDLPAVVYFHENQLTYPVRFENERDYQFAMTNLTSMLAADAVWFNSRFHLESLMEALETFLRRMPDFQPVDSIAEIHEKSTVQPPGIEPFPLRQERSPGPIHFLWASRWEYDKNPEEFFQALHLIKNRGIGFRLTVLGEAFRDSPAVFGEARKQFEREIVRWGFLPDPEDYRRALLDTDVFVSTAHHEFFGIGTVEAILAGNYPLLPKRLAYPELLDLSGSPESGRFYYSVGAESLAGRMEELSARLEIGDSWAADVRRAVEKVSRFRWDSRVPRMDEALESLRAGRSCQRESA